MAIVFLKDMTHYIINKHYISYENVHVYDLSISDLFLVTFLSSWHL